MISTYFRTRVWAIAGIALLSCAGGSALSQSKEGTAGFFEHDALTPPLLFREVWQQPPHTGPLNDENRRITSEALTNKDLTLQSYGPDVNNNLRLQPTQTSREWFRPNPPLPSIKWGPRNNTNIQESALLLAMNKVAKEKELYLTPGGKYSTDDIAANGNMTASQKFKGLRASHDAKPKVGDKLCPISMTKASPKFTWIVGGQAYQFCCPPCIDEFVRTAKEKPAETAYGGATLLPASETTRKEPELEPVSRSNDDLNVDAVFAKLKTIGGKKPDQE